MKLLWNQDFVLTDLICDQVTKKDWRGLCLWFQGLDSLPGVKGEKGILGFPGPRVSGLPSLHNLDCVWLMAWLTADVELAAHEMFALWWYLMVTFTWCHRDFLVMMGCQATKVLKWVQFKLCWSSLSDFFKFWNHLFFRGFKEVQVSQVWLDEKARGSVLVIM